MSSWSLRRGGQGGGRGGNGILGRGVSHSHSRKSWAQGDPAAYAALDSPQWLWSDTWDGVQSVSKTFMELKTRRGLEMQLGS